MRSLVRSIRNFKRAEGGSIVVMFALLLVPLVGAAGAAVDFSSSNSLKSAMQGSLDATALLLIKEVETLPKDQLAAKAQSFFDANFNRPIKVSVASDIQENMITLAASAEQPNQFMKLFGLNKTTVRVTSASGFGGGDIWPVCVLVTEPTNNHTLLVQDKSSIDFKDCLVQVNTQNWDAVEARDTSYIRSVNGVNCFTGDIHYGDVTPPKELTCKMFEDPYTSLKIPTPAACTAANTNRRIESTTTLNPGTFCGRLEIKAATTFNPGVYIISGGQLVVSGKLFDVVAKGVTFILTGKDAGVLIDLEDGKFQHTPANAAAAGELAGFAFFLDPATLNAKSASVFKKVKATMSGVVYLKGQKLEFEGATVTIDPGSIIAHYILPDRGSKLVLNGSLSTSTTTETQMRKSVGSKRPILLPPGQAKKIM